jgi:GDPmannose 4,6-dehydratase
MSTAFITGLNGQDGSYLAEFLLQKNYYVTGIIRRASTLNHLSRLSDAVRQNARFQMHYGDIVDSTAMHRLIREWVKEHEKTCERFEIYNLAAQSHVQVSFELPEYTNHTNVMGVYNLLNAIIALPKDLQNKVRFYQASTSEMFGNVQTIPQTENTPFYPRSPYAVSKVAGYWATKNYRESYSLFACNGILFNHESERRGETFVTRKITRAVGLIKYGKQKCLRLGNLDAKRDWGHAKDYVRAMWLVMQQKTPDDYVIATGKQYSVRQFVEIAFDIGMGIKIEWKGSGLDEIGVDAEHPERILVHIDEKFFRPAEVESLLGDATKAQVQLGWTPEIDFKDLVQEMIEFDCFLP